MFLTFQQRRIVEEIAWERGLACHDCGSSSLRADTVEASLGGEGEIYYKCLKCSAETSLDLSYKEAERLDLHWVEDLPETGP